MKHKLLTPAECPCTPDYHCYVCDGGLNICTVCHGTEASLPTDCPGYQMSGELQDLVQNGTQDFVTGVGWVLQSTYETHRYRMRKEMVSSDC